MCSSDLVCAEVPVQEGEEREETARRGRSSPGAWRRHGEAGGGPTARRRCTTTMAGGGVGRVRFARLEAPRHGAVGEGGGELEAERREASARAPAVGGVGGRDGRGGDRSRRRRGRGARVRVWGLRARESEEEGSRGRPPCPLAAGRGGPAARQQERPRRRPGHGASAGHCGAREEAHLAITPPEDLNSLQKGPSADFNDLKRALRYFYKFQNKII